ncbi:PR domain zinc finger protein 15-like [Argiope bruennichi]|uniref:PR domain zinc finger protein 15-like n=1 Tax=Argiope bruennichi TaxID=94029 RepID=UPI002493EB70|nr:PR domain zinc finger protein 15-like [Argiope bruennichi]
MESSMIHNSSRYLCTLCPFSSDVLSDVQKHNRKCHSVLHRENSAKVIPRSKLRNRVNASISPSSSRVLRRPSSSRVLRRPSSSRVLRRPSSSRVLRRPSSSRVLRRPSSSTVLRRPRVSKASTSGKKPLRCACKTEVEESQSSTVRIKEQYQCRNCDGTFFSEAELIRHINDVHLINSEQAMCDLCFEVFPTLNTMTYHRRLHMLSQSFTCPFCQKIFYDVIAFRNHETLHEENNRIKK